MSTWRNRWFWKVSGSPWGFLVMLWAFLALVWVLAVAPINLFQESADDYSGALAPYEAACLKLRERFGNGRCIADRYSVRFYVDRKYVGMESVR